ncbi:MAG: hypothetical protein QOF53_1424 [Nocardioidaceae bacterium]|nr:hypothetical protein [Nocardioidaceae bacterium]
MTVARKLQIPPASTVVVLGSPTDIDLEIPDDCLVLSDPAAAKEAQTVISFLVRAEDLDEVAGPAIEAAREDRLSWIAYPKARQLGTDLNRDVLARLVEARGAQPVRSVAIDAVWSSLRFRPL